jgi:hypothetical protein
METYAKKHFWHMSTMYDQYEQYLLSMVTFFHMYNFDLVDKLYTFVIKSEVLMHNTTGITGMILLPMIDFINNCNTNSIDPNAIAHIVRIGYIYRRSRSRQSSWYDNFVACKIQV